MWAELQLDSCHVGGVRSAHKGLGREERRDGGREERRGGGGEGRKGGKEGREGRADLESVCVCVCVCVCVNNKMNLQSAIS